MKINGCFPLFYFHYQPFTKGILYNFTKINEKTFITNRSRKCRIAYATTVLRMLFRSPRPRLFEKFEWEPPHAAQCPRSALGGGPHRGITELMPTEYRESVCINWKITTDKRQTETKKWIKRSGPEQLYII